ncbi:MAG: DUF3048 domain-containing protein [Anaerolineaceae bacterium]
MRVFILLMFLFLFGCAPTESPAESVQIIQPATSAPAEIILTPALAKETVETPHPEEEAGQDVLLNPLTGQPPDDPALLKRRPVMVKVSNYPRYGRPHAGLSSADIVFEYYIGEMFNRFLAVYYGSDSAQVGPIRSGRLVDAQLANQFQGILVYGNADDRVDEILAEKLGERAVPTKYGVCPPICGTETHSIAGVFVDAGLLSSNMRGSDPEDFQPDLSSFIFDENPPDNGTGADFLAVQYAEINRGEWHFDPDSGAYLRWIEETDENEDLYMAPLVDRNTGSQLSFSNVVILSTFYVEFNRTLHNIDMTNNTTGQQALIFRDGNLYQGLWRSVDPNKPFQLLDPFGNPFPLKPGKTWIVLAGISSQFRQPEPGSWELLFYLP